MSNESRPDGRYTLHCSRRFVGHLSSGVACLAPEERRRLTSHLDLVHYLAANPGAGPGPGVGRAPEAPRV